MERKECTNKKINEEDCPCEYDSCERHGVCCLCIKHHKDIGGKPACLK